MADILFIVTTAPYTYASTDECHDFIMASTAYGHRAQVIFEGDGIEQLLKQQIPINQQKHAAKRISGFSFFDIEPLWLCAQSVKDKDINRSELIDDLRIIQPEDKAKLIQQSAFVIYL